MYTRIPSLLHTIILRIAVESPESLREVIDVVKKILEGNEAELEKIFFGGLCIAGLLSNDKCEWVNPNDPLLRVIAKILGNALKYNIPIDVLDFVVL